MGGARHKILYVEDNSLLALGIKRNLELFGGYDVLYARNVRAALNCARENATIKVLITDLMLDEYAPFGKDETQNGYLAGSLLIKEIHNLLPVAKVIAMSVMPDHPSIEDLKTLSTVKYAGKLLPWRELKRRLDAILEGEMWSPEVFIVHGHDEELLSQILKFLRSLLQHARITVLRDAEKRGGTIIELLERHVATADVVFVLLSEDDPGRSPVEDSRARQNVVFEAGLCMGMKGRQSGRVILLRKGRPEIWSDISGLYLIDVSQGIGAAAPEIIREINWLRNEAPSS